MREERKKQGVNCRTVISPRTDNYGARRKSELIPAAVKFHSPRFLTRSLHIRGGSSPVRTVSGGARAKSLDRDASPLTPLSLSCFLGSESSQPRPGDAMHATSIKRDENGVVSRSGDVTPFSQRPGRQAPPCTLAASTFNGDTTRTGITREPRAMAYVLCLPRAADTVSFHRVRCTPCEWRAPHFPCGHSRRVLASYYCERIFIYGRASVAFSLSLRSTIRVSLRANICVRCIADQLPVSHLKDLREPMGWSVGAKGGSGDLLRVVLEIYEPFRISCTAAIRVRERDTKRARGECIYTLAPSRAFSIYREHEPSEVYRIYSTKVYCRIALVYFIYTLLYERFRALSNFHVVQSIFSATTFLLISRLSEIYFYRVLFMARASVCYIRGKWQRARRNSATFLDVQVRQDIFQRRGGGKCAARLDEASLLFFLAPFLQIATFFHARAIVVNYAICSIYCIYCVAAYLR